MSTADGRWINTQQQEAVSSFLRAFADWEVTAEKLLTPRKGADVENCYTSHLARSYELGSTRPPTVEHTPIRGTRPYDFGSTRTSLADYSPAWARTPSRHYADREPFPTPSPVPAYYRADIPPLRDPGAGHRSLSVPPGRHEASKPFYSRLEHPSVLPPQLQSPASPYRSAERYSYASRAEERRPASPRAADRPSWTSYTEPIERFSWVGQPTDQLLKEALRVMARQAQVATRIEDAKALLPASCTVEEAFAQLDRTTSGYLSSTDLRMLAEDFGGTLTFACFRALVRELRLQRLQADVVVMPERVCFRDLGTLMFPVGTKAYHAMCNANTDEEAQTLLYLLKYTEPCPTCGIPVQRDANAAGCPSVTCSVCKTAFRCYSVVGDKRPDAWSEPLSTAGRYQLHRLVTTAARAAEELEEDRRKLSLMLAYQLCGLIDVFKSLAGAGRSFGISDLRRAFLHHNLLLSEEELGLLWHRYAPNGEGSVGFPDFRRQLQTSI